MSKGVFFATTFQKPSFLFVMEILEHSCSTLCVFTFRMLSAHKSRLLTYFQADSKCYTYAFSLKSL